MTKIEIINAAFRVWGRNFYRKTSLSQLASELKVSKPALYRHFANKQALNDAMTEKFLDDFASSIRGDFENALLEKDADRGISIVLGTISNFFARNAYALIFSLIKIYDRNLDTHTIVKHLKSRSIDMAVLQIVIEKKYSGGEKLIRLVFATLTFLMSHFHKTKKSMCKHPSDEEIKSITSAIDRTVKKGIGFSENETAINFENLEKQIDESGKTINPQIEPFFKAVAQAVAEAGPWDVSMDMVAKKLGLSKSSLYGHFKNKKEMLRLLFVTEFKRIIEFARNGISLSSKTAEQLYLGIFSIAVYLRSRPEILIAMDWIRTRKLDLGKPDKNFEIFRLFEDIDIKTEQNTTEEDKQRISHWILFLLINILTNPIRTEKKSRVEVKNNDIRLLYKFITLGLGGFIQ